QLTDYESSNIIVAGHTRCRRLCLSRALAHCAMRHLVTFLIAALLLVGCRTNTQETNAVQPFAKDKRLAEIYEDLKKVPIPTPKTTPFDGDSHRRDTYLAGFREGWDFAISGRIVYAEMNGPAGIESDLISVWQDGAREGSRLGGEQLMARLDLKK